MAKYYVVYRDKDHVVGIYTTLVGVSSDIGVSDETIRRWIGRYGYYGKGGVYVCLADGINKSRKKSILGRKRFKG